VLPNKINRTRSWLLTTLIVPNTTLKLQKFKTVFIVPKQQNPNSSLHPRSYGTHAQRAIPLNHFHFLSASQLNHTPFCRITALTLAEPPLSLSLPLAASPLSLSPHHCSHSLSLSQLIWFEVSKVYFMFRFLLSCFC
jgi:hypothetical protein